MFESIRASRRHSAFALCFVWSARRLDLA